MELTTFEKAEKVVEEIRAVDEQIKKLEKAEMKGGWIQWPQGEYLKPRLREKLLTTMRDYKLFLNSQLMDIQDEKEGKQTTESL